MKKSLMVLLSLFLVLSLAGCSSAKEGRVYEKVYEPESTFIMIMMIPIPAGKSTVMTPLPMIVHDDEDWILKVESYTDRGQRVTSSFYVNEDVYAQYLVGDWYSVPEGVKPQTRDNISNRKATIQEIDKYGVSKKIPTSQEISN